MKGTSILKSLNKQLSCYIPTSLKTPIQKALYEPSSIYNLEKKKTESYQFKSIKYAFQHHYQNNTFYKAQCDKKKISPTDIKTVADLEKIPLLPDKFYKDYPSGKKFATWIANIMSTPIPKITIKGKNPSFDDIITAFQKKGINISYSSGTTGRFTFIPRDTSTYTMGQYAIARCAIEMLSHWWQYDSYAYLLFPNPKKTHIYVGQVTNVLFDMIQNVQVAIDRAITTDLLRISMGFTLNFKERMMNKVIKSSTKKMNVRMIEDILNWVQQKAEKKQRMAFAGAPFILNLAMDRLLDAGITYDFGNLGAVLTGGGWKLYEDKRLPVEDFRKKVFDVFGIPPENCLDLYSMVEGNGFMIHCPEGHYLHIPTSYFYPLVLDETGSPVEYGEKGRFAFFDSLAQSYPGFISTGDQVKIYEHCPACGRSTPVLDPEVTRMGGEEDRGCAAEMRRLLLDG